MNVLNEYKNKEFPSVERKGGASLFKFLSKMWAHTFVS